MLSGKTDELINFVMRQKHSGMRRILLSVLLDMPLPELFPVAFMDFCYERILDRNEKVAVQSLCIKIVYKLCLLEPALFSELQAVLESIELYVSSPAIKSCICNTLKKIRDKKSRPTLL
ncbi:MAG: hypothetical protein LBM07_02970 [Culturomica sp.]|jgi:hypothetical protein|nr:hypothetical protein [Culturomica sp.]